MYQIFKRRLSLFFLVGVFFGYGQTSVRTTSFADNSLPKETIFIHYNSSLLFAGERLYYKIHCLNAKTLQTSQVSKIAYVQLVGQDKKAVFTHKIRLKSGSGYGHFLVPVTLASGSYKLLGHTQWMKNEGTDSFFQEDIGVINPYLENQGALLQDTEEESQNPMALTDVAPLFPGNRKEKTNSSEHLELHISNEIYGKRRPVTIIIKSREETDIQGNYSLSVRKIDTLYLREQISTNTFRSKVSGLATKSSQNNADLYLPELRGELFSGRVTHKSNGNAAENIKVAISIPDEDFIFQVGNTNADGRFYVNLDSSYSSEDIIFQIISENMDELNLDMDTRNTPDFSHLSFAKLVITPEVKDAIIKRSIYNQIENAYVEITPDSLIAPESILPFYRELEKVYYLDDYNRFPSIRETMVEIIENAWFKKNEKGQYFFQVRGYEPFVYSDLMPLVMVDGVFVQDHSDALELDAKQVQKIAYTRKRLHIGAQVFQGMLVFETFNKENNIPEETNSIQIQKVAPPFPKYTYFVREYEEGRNNNQRIPDFRTQLCWIPELNIEKKENSYTFYTSDVPGNYEISLEGYMEDGTPVSIRDFFEVQ